MYHGGGGGRRRPHEGGGGYGGGRRPFDGRGRGGRGGGRGGGGRGRGRGELIPTQDLQIVGTEERQLSTVEPGGSLEDRLSALTVVGDAGGWIEPRGPSLGVPYREARVATNVWRLVPASGAATDTICVYHVQRLKKEFVADGDAAPAAPDAAPAPPPPVVAAPAGAGARPEEVLADGTRKPSETQKRRTLEAMRAVGEQARVQVFSDGARMLYACGPLEPHMSASGVVVAPVAGKPWRRWRVQLQPVTTIDVAEALQSTAVEDVARTASGELVDACTGERHHFSTIIDLAIKAHMTQNGYWDLGSGTYLVQGAPVRCREGGLDILLGVDVGVRRCEAGTCLAVDLVAKAAVRTPGALSTVSDLIIALFGERGPRSPKEVEKLKQLLHRKNVTILRKDFGGADEFAEISRKNFKDRGRLVATSASDMTFERNGETISIATYQERKGHPLRFPHHPVIRIDAGLEYEEVMGEDGLKRRQPKRDADGKKIEKVIYIPAERLRLEEGQHARGINMADEIIRLLSVRPSARHGQIVDHVARSRITSSPALAAIGLQLAPRSLAVVAKIFPAPLLFARNRGRVLQLGGHKLGEWRQENQVFRVAAPEHRNVLVLDMGGGRASPDAVRNYVDELRRACRDIDIQLGDPFDPSGRGGPGPQLVAVVRPDSSVADVTHAAYEACQRCGVAKPDLVLVVIKKSQASLSESDYGKIKRFQHQTGVMTSCVTVESLKTAGSARYRDIVRAIAAKINAKFGGVNRAVVSAESARSNGEPVDFHPWTGAAPTALVAVHVALAGAYDSTIPSMVTAACTVDKLMSQFRFASRVAPLDARLDEHLADVIGLAVCDVLSQFAKINGPPQLVVAFRTGAFAGEDHRRMLELEPPAIKRRIREKASAHFDGEVHLTYCPMTKSRVRVFPSRESGTDNDRSMNVPPSLFVDSGLTHPTAHEFFVNTYAGIQGCNNLQHCRVILNEAQCPPDVLMSIVAALAYAYPKANRAVKLPALSYMASLVCDAKRLVIKNGEEAPGVGDDFPFHPALLGGKLPFM